MLTGILDVSHWEYDQLQGNLAPALAQARAAGIVAVIAKATQGKDYVDPTWNKWARAITDAGLLLGAYHFGSNTKPGDQQADFFLANTTNADRLRTLYVLDFEVNPTASRTMDLCDARTFVHRIEARTGKHTMLYSGSSFLSQVNDPVDVLGQVPLWVAAYGPTQPTIPRAWRTKGWTLFQYTDGKFGPANQTEWPRRTPGLGAVDRSAFKGTVEELRARWPDGF